MLPMILSLALLAEETSTPMRFFSKAPVSVERRADGVWFIDFGQAWYGTLEFDLVSDQTQELAVAVGEKLAGPAGLDSQPGGSIVYRAVTLTMGPGQTRYRVTWAPQPRHADPAAVHLPAEFGEVTVIRAVELRGWHGELDADQVRLLAVHVPFDDGAAEFACSDPVLTRVWQLCQHPMAATTAFGVYIDGERERIAYEADAYLNQLSHYAVQAEFETARRTFDHLLAKPTWPTEWSLHMPLIAWADWRATGSVDLAERHWAALRAKLLADRARPDGLLVAYGIIDWPAGERDGYGGGEADPKDKRQVGPEVNTVVNAFYLAATRAMADLAAATGRVRESLELRAAYAAGLVAFNNVFLDAERGVYRDGEGSEHASLHGNALPLAFGLVPDAVRDRVADFVVSRGMACSVYGAQYLLDGLFSAGRDGAAIELLTSRGERSWAHMLDLGATMTLEAWDAKFKPNLTWNHAWGAVPANAIARWVLGVRPLEPGYGKVLVAPRLGGLQWARGKVPTIKGPVEVVVDRRTGQFEVLAPDGVQVSLVDPFGPATGQQ